MRNSSDKERLEPSLRWMALLLLLLAVGCDGDLGTEATTQASRPKRILLITLDTLRLDAFEGRKGAPSAMPLTREWAKQARIFDRHYSATPTTQPTHATLLTGLHPWQHGITYNGLVLGEEASTIPERLKQAGFRTAAVVSSFPLHRSFGFKQGFDHFFDDFQHDFLAMKKWSDAAVPGGKFFSLAARVTDKAIEALDSADGRDEFLWLHYFDPHAPYGATQKLPMQVGEIVAGASQPPARRAALLARARRLYVADVRSMDVELNRLFQRLKQDEARFDTHIFVTADHGESFGEQGVLGHGSRLSEEQLHVPLIVYSSLVESGRDHRVTGSIDVAHAILTTAGLSQETAQESSAPALFASAGGRGAFGMFQTSRHSPPERRTDGRTIRPAPLLFYSIRENRIVTGTTKGIDDKSLDEREGATLKTLFGSFERGLRKQSPEANLDEKAIEALRALGYVE